MRGGDLEGFGPVSKPQERFTPGPWQIDPDASGLDGWPIRAKQGPIDVCPAKAHGLADAQLIAASPELYEVVRAVFGSAEFFQVDEKIAAKARAALAKAEGRS